MGTKRFSIFFRMLSIGAVFLLAAVVLTGCAEFLEDYSFQPISGDQPMTSGSY